MINEKEIMEFSPTDIVSIDAITALGVFSLERLNQIQSVAYTKGMTAAAEIIRERLRNYQDEHGIYDHDTGTTEYPKGGDEYVAELQEIADAILTARDKKDSNG